MSRKPRKPSGGASVPARLKTSCGDARPTSGRRVWLFRLAAIVLGPVLFLGLLELVLRAVGYGYNPHVAVKCEIDRQPYLGENVKFGWRFFPPILAREFEPFAFPVRKSPDTYRIFVLGASAAQGIPNHAFCFGRFLQYLLQERFPGVHFEVVTAAMAAINSHVVLEIAKDCARYDLDLFVVYMGNNEVVGPYGPGTVLTPALSNLHLIRLGIALRATKIGQLAYGLSGSHGLGKGSPLSWRGMEMFLGQQVRADDPRLATTYGHFRRNLQDICRIGAGAGAETVLCTIGTNLRDCPPFASLHRQDLTQEQQKNWDTTYKQGVEAESQGKWAEATALYLQAAQIDDSYAELQFRLGRCYQLAGDHENARDRYVRARDLDTLRFRSDTRINEVIREVADQAKRPTVHLANVAEALDANSPHGLPGEEFFYEHVHLTFEGNYIVAKTVLEQIEPLVSTRFGDKARACGTLPTQQQCAERLAYNDWSRQETLGMIVHQFLAKAPFTNQLYHAEQVGRLSQQLKTMEAALTPQTLKGIGQQYLAAVEKAPDDWRLRWDYGKLLAEDLKQYDAAAAQYRIVQQYLPHSYIGHDALAAVLSAKGDFVGAAAEYQRELAIKPTSGAAYHHLGSCYHKQGKTEQAADCYRKAIRFEPDRVPAYVDLAESLVNRQQLEEAARVCRQGLAVVPNSAWLHRNLGALLLKMGKREEAAEEIRTAVKLDPNSPQMRKAAERVLGPGTR
ncbi:MAG: tetratricopeptide repeat protein [Phycisphaerae bacterium]|nr:tetratricopeptide repeat protein [Phycisphaerae bacterium]